MSVIVRGLALRSLMPLHRSVAVHASRRPDAVALDDGELRLTYAQLDARARALAAVLASHGVGPGSFVVLLAERSAETIVGIVGIWYAGAAYVSIAAEIPAARMQRVREATGARFLVAPRRDVAPGFAGLTVVALDEIESRDGDGFEPVAAAPDDPAYAVATSGSTGLPKLVVVRQRNVDVYTAAIVALLGPSDRPRCFATTGSFAADLGNTAIFAALATGGTFCVLRYEDVLDGAATGRRIVSCGVDVLKTTPSHLHALFADAGTIVPRETLIVGGESLPWDTVRAVRSLRPDVTVINHYGPTETTVGALAHRVVPGEEIEARGTVPIGVPLDGMRAYVLDERGRPVGIGETGELYVGGGGVGAGYLGLPLDTAARFTADPFAPAEAAEPLMYRTGDHVRCLGDGTLEFIGRFDTQVKIGGNRVEPSEVAVLLREHPLIADACVVARSAGGDVALDAYLIGEPVEAADMRAFAAQYVPAYMIPRTWTFIERFPLTANGKLDVAALPPPHDHGPRTAGTLTDATQTRVATLWREVLGVEQVGADDDFFDLGGHSLMATIATARLCEHFGVALSLRTFFDTSTVAGIAAHIDELLLAKALGELDALSDEDVRRLLAEADH